MASKPKSVDVFVMQDKGTVGPPFWLQQLGMKVNHFNIRNLHRVEVCPSLPTRDTVPLSGIFPKHAQWNGIQIGDRSIQPHRHVPHDLNDGVPKLMQRRFGFRTRAHHEPFNSIDDRPDGLPLPRQKAPCP